MPAAASSVLTPGLARAYFALQAAAGAGWWIGVFLSETLRLETLGDLPAIPVAAADIPLFVLASALAAAGVRAAIWVIAAWTPLVALAMAVYATVTGLAGWGALLMAASAGATIAAALIVLLGRAPVEWIARGPLAFRAAAPAGRRRLLLRTAAQTSFFWGLFLLVIPAAIALIEARWGLRVEMPWALRLIGAPALLAATALGVWAGLSMTVRGDGTPLPSSMPRRLVVAGPYRFVRNPMAVAGIAQGVAVGLLTGSWVVILYALCGSIVWNVLVRPLEEADLAARFGAEFAAYRQAVPCWIPRASTRSQLRRT